MEPRIAFGMIVFNGNYVLKECLESVYEFASQILISEGPVKYWQEQGYETSTDGTNDILHEFYDPDNKIVIEHGQFEEKNEQCNRYIQHMKDDTDYIWNLDSDEIFKKDDMHNVFHLLSQKPGSEISVGFKSVSFYGGFDRYMSGFEEDAEFIRIRKVYPGSYWLTHRPPTIAHPSHDPMHTYRRTPEHISFNTLAEAGIRMYHYSYVFPEQVKQKISYYKSSVSKENCIDEYYENIYSPWVKNPSKREEIEKKWSGVHEFKPGVRGDCYTRVFGGKHPKIIEDSIESLQEKFNNQLEVM